MIPQGATHYTEAYGITCYFKRSFWFRGVESGEEFHAWHYWTGKEWMCEAGINTDKLVKIEA